ncbi:MAG: hypothetical protein EX270_11475 [Pseudomonadales bacterium]|nr:MAG: hypothetical protein EX270_11475 [Pseudomonadales bacterium]
MNNDQATTLATNFFDNISSNIAAAAAMMSDDAVFNYNDRVKIQGPAELRHSSIMAAKRGMISVSHKVSRVCVGKNDGEDLIALTLTSYYVLDRSPDVEIRGLATLTIDGDKITECFFCTDTRVIGEYSSIADELGSASPR